MIFLTLCLNFVASFNRKFTNGAIAVTALVTFVLSLYLGYGMMFDLPVAFLATYQIREAVFSVTYFLPWAILVGVVWIVALITFSWISFRKCELK